MMTKRETRYIPDDCWHCGEPIVDKRDYFCIQGNGTENLYVHKSNPCKRAATAHVVKDSA